MLSFGYISHLLAQFCIHTLESTSRDFENEEEQRQQHEIKTKSTIIQDKHGTAKESRQQQHVDVKMPHVQLYSH